MPLLIKNVTGTVLDNLSTNINKLSFVEGSFGYSEWFKIGNLEVFLQNFKNVDRSEPLITPNKFGLVVNNNKTFVELEISY